MRIRILKSAQEDLKEGCWFYESQEAGLGDYFLDALTSDIERIGLICKYLSYFLKVPWKTRPGNSGRMKTKLPQRFCDSVHRWFYKGVRLDFLIEIL